MKIVTFYGKNIFKRGIKKIICKKFIVHQNHPNDPVVSAEVTIPKIKEAIAPISTAVPVATKGATDDQSTGSYLFNSPDNNSVYRG